MSDAIDGYIHGNRLSFIKGRIGFLFVDIGVGADPKGVEPAYTLLCPKAQLVLSEFCLFGYDKGGGKLIHFFNDNIFSGDSIRVEEYFLSTGEALSCDHNFLRAAGLSTTRKKRADYWFGRLCKRNDEKKRKKLVNHIL